MEAKCHVCHYNSNFLLQKSGYNLFRCSNCNLIFVNPLPSIQKLKKVYSHETGYQSSKIKDLSQIVEDKKTTKILDYISNNNKGKLLDVGCSNGQFIYFAKRRGFDVFGVELNTDTARIAKTNKLKVFNGTLEQAGYKSGSFDVIFLGDIIEHVTDPRDLIKRCIDLLKKDGLLVISTPNMDCFWVGSSYFWYKLLKIPMSVVTPPYHLYQFSFKNLNLLASQTGLKIKKYWYSSPPKLFHELYHTQLAQNFYDHKTSSKNHVEG